MLTCTHGAISGWVPYSDRPGAIASWRNREAEHCAFVGSEFLETQRRKLGPINQSRSRKAATFARLPHKLMLHHRRV